MTKIRPALLLTHITCLALGLVAGLAISGSLGSKGEGAGIAKVDPTPSKSDRPSEGGNGDSKVSPGVRKKEATELQQQPLPPEELLSAEEAIAAVREKYSDQELRSKMWRTGKNFGQRGYEAACDFISNAPPGTIGMEGLGGMAEGVSADVAPRIFEYLQTAQDRLSEDQILATSFRVFHCWSSKDFESAWAYVSRLDPAANKDVLKYLQAALPGASPERAITAVNAIADPELRLQVLGNQASVAAHLKTRNYTALYEGLGERLSDGNVVVSFRNAMRDCDDKAGALTALQKSNAEGKNAILSPTVTDWLTEDTTAALTFLQSANDQKLTSQVVAKSYKQIASYNREWARQWIELIQDPAVRERAKREVGF